MATAIPLESSRSKPPPYHVAAILPHCLSTLNSSTNLLLRVTPQIKMTTLISLSLDHLSSSASSSSSSSIPTTTTPAPLRPTVTIYSSSSSSLPKLVSVVEVVKRARVEQREELEGLHQYTGLGVVEEYPAGPSATLAGERAASEEEDEEEEDIEMVATVPPVPTSAKAKGKAKAIDGDEEQDEDFVIKSWLSTGGATKRPKRKHTPFMVVVLGSSKVAELEMGGPNQSLRRKFTYQAPPPSSQVKAAKRKRDAAATDPTSITIDPPVVPSAHASTDVDAAPPARKKKKKRIRTKKKKAGTGAEGGKENAGAVVAAHESAGEAP